MARMTSAFQKSLRREEDRIDRKRKENREAFEKFREMRIKNETLLLLKTSKGTGRT